MKPETDNTTQFWVRYLPRFIRERLESRSYLQRVIGNAGWLFADRILRMLVGFLVGIWIARYLGPEQYGILNYAGAFVFIFTIVSTLGLEGLAVRDIVREPDHKNEILGTVLLLRISGGLLLVLITATSIHFIRPNDGLVAELVLLISITQVFQAFDAIDCWFQANVTSRYTVIAKAIVLLALTAVRIALVIAKVPLVAFAWAIAGEALLGALAMLMAYHISGQRMAQWRIRLDRVKRLLAEGWPLIFSGFVITIYIRIDQVMLGQMTGFGDVGAYSVAVRLLEVWYVIPVVLTASIFPAIIRSKDLDNAVYEARIQRLYDSMVWMAIAIALPISLLAPFLVKWLYGSAYASAGPVLALLSWMAIWVFFGVARQKWLFAENALKAGMAVEIAGCVLNVLANLVLIPRFGTIGAAIASLMAATGANLIVAIFSRSIRHSLLMLAKTIMAPVRMARLC